MSDSAVVEVRELLGDELSDLEIRVLCGAGKLGNRITNPRVQKPGLAFAGYYEYVKPGRVQIIGESETEFLKRLPPAVRKERFETIISLDIPVFIVTKGLEPEPELLARCQEIELPILSSKALSSSVIKRVSYFLEEHLVPSTRVHGVLLIGTSGAGKSEAALDLITRGHSLVADDRVWVKRYPNGELLGSCEEPLRHHMELRGIGIINVQDLFGLAAVRERKPIDLVIELEHWDETKAYDRLGLDETVYEILDTPCPYLKLPVALGRNVSNLVEIAVRNHVLKLQGHHSAREFTRKLEAKMARRRPEE